MVFLFFRIFFIFYLSSFALFSEGLLIDEIQEPKSILPYSLIRWEERRVGALPEQQPYLSFASSEEFRGRMRSTLSSSTHSQSS